MLFLAIFLIIGTKAYDQSRASLEKEQKKIEKNIKLAQKALDAARKRKKGSIAQLNATKQLISMRSALIRSLEKEVAVLQSDANELSDIVQAMQNDLDSLQAEFGEMVYQASKVNNNLNHLTLVFSSKSYNDLTMRLKFLEEISKMRETQVRKIKQVKMSLEERNHTLALKYEQKKETLDKLKDEKLKLNKLRSSQQKLVNKLKGKESELLQRIKKLQRDKEKLQKIIQQKIEEERRRFKVDKKLSAKFEMNKGRLPKPIANSYVEHKFGRQPHPKFKSLMINNLGIGLQTPTKSAKVQAVFEGKVIAAEEMPGVGLYVVVSHGKYNSTYVGLATISVKVGQVVFTGDKLGTVRANRNGEYILDFQIFEKSKAVNPAPWLRM